MQEPGFSRLYQGLQTEMETRIMTPKQIIQQTAAYVRQEFARDSSGHDWWHIYRVWKNALAICQHENADVFTVELAALLHDLDDWKLSPSGSSNRICYSR
jgi:HD superfamily phosphodiesterase